MRMKPMAILMKKNAMEDAVSSTRRTSSYPSALHKMQSVVPKQVRHAAVSEGRAKVAALAGFALLPYLVL